MFSLKGKTALITGASGGIGKAIARAFDRQGAKLLLSGRREKELRRVADGLKRRSTRIVAADLARGEDVERLCDAIKKTGVDILVNNAGITRDGLAVRLRAQDWQDVIDVDLSAAFQLCRAAFAGMMRARWGRIINISSVVASGGNAGQVAYGAAKAGLEGMTRCLAREVGSRSITVNAIAPGYVETAMTEKLDDMQRSRILDGVPCARAGKGEDVAAAAVFLASEEASYVTGHTVAVNGGMRM